MEWHCSYFWEHALDKKNITHSLKTKNKLLNYVAIPIWIKKTVGDYEELANKLLKL